MSDSHTNHSGTDLPNDPRDDESEDLVHSSTEPGAEPGAEDDAAAASGRSGAPDDASLSGDGDLSGPRDSETSLVDGPVAGDAVQGEVAGADALAGDEAHEVAADAVAEGGYVSDSAEGAGSVDGSAFEAVSNDTAAGGSAPESVNAVNEPHASELPEGSDGADDLDSSNPYAAYAAYDPYVDDSDDEDEDGSDVTDEEAYAYRTAEEYSRVNAATHYQQERKGVMLPVLVALVAGVVVVAGLCAFLFGTRPATRVALDNLGITSDSSSASDTDAEAAQTDPVDINITMVGDVLSQSSVVSAAQTSAGDYDFSYLFSSVEDDIKDADLALVDQESAIAGQSYGYGGSVPYNAPDALASAEKDAGIDAVLKASNYALDLGYDGLHDEIASWAENEPDVQVLGVADPEGSAGTDHVSNVYVYEKDGFKVAILNYTYGTDTTVSSSTDANYVATLSEDKVKSDVQAARDAGADMIVACPHWGVEYSSTLSDEQTTYGQLFADQGVDVVLGDHPHVVQPVTLLTGSGGNTCVCFYSLGNFVSGTRSSSALVGSLAKVTLHKDSDGTCSVTAASLVPVVTHRANSSSSYSSSSTGTTAGFGVYRLSDYTDQIARQGWDTYLTPDYVRNMLDETLSDLTYDEDSGSYQVDLGQSAQSTSDSSSTETSSE